MKNLFVILVVCFSVFNHVYSNSYYVSNSGNDNWAGSQSRPWQTISKVNGFTFSTGDTIYLKCGDLWREMLAPPRGGLIFTSYGTGALPIISACDTVTGWNDPSNWTQNGNIWSFPLNTNPFRIWLSGIEYGWAGALGNVGPRYRWHWTGSPLYVWSSSGNPATAYTSVVASYIGREYALYNLNRHNNQFYNIQFEGGIVSVQVKNSNNLKFSNCIITKNCTQGFKVDYCDSLQILFCNFASADTAWHNIEAVPGSQNGLHIMNGTGGYVYGCKFSDWGHSALIVPNGAGPVRYWLFDSCEFTHVADYGRALDLQGTAKGACSYNVFTRLYIHHMPNRSQIGGDHNTIAYSVVDTMYEKTGWTGGSYGEAGGFALITGGSPQIVDSNTIANCVIANCDDAGMVIGNYATVTNNFITNNIIYNCGKNPYSAHPEWRNACLLIYQLNSSNWIRNNIFYSPGGTSTIFYHTNSGSRMTVSALNDSTGHHGDVINNNLAKDPLFVNASINMHDFHLTPGSPAIDAGVNVPHLTKDYDGVTVPQASAVDIGAYEYDTGEPPDTIKPTIRITSPVDGDTVRGTVQVTVSATDNHGVSRVEYTVNANPAGTVYNAPFTLSWNTEGLGGVGILVARAYDAAGNNTSDSVMVVIEADSQSSKSQNIALKKPAYASSVQSNLFPPSNAVDTIPDNRWASQFSDPQWICVNLRSTYKVDSIVLHWEAAYAISYQLQVSLDSINWTVVYSTTSSQGGFDDIMISPIDAHYVRMYGTQRATSWGYSLYSFEVYTVGSNITDVEPQKHQIPSEYILQNNFPNPFNPITLISYSLPEESYVRLTIYNILGEEIRTLVQKVEDAGNKAVEWNAVDQAGKTIPSGVYFYRLDARSVSNRAKSFTDVKKMLYCK